MVKVFAGFFEESLDIYSSDVVVVIDVLRFSSTVTTALDIGVKEAIVCKNYDDALRLARELGVPLVAEINGFKPEGVDTDNSPVQVIQKFSTHPPERIVVRSTAGAALFSKAVEKGFKEVVIGSLINASAVASYVGELNPESVLLAMAGYKAKFFAIEDFLGAGAIAAELTKIVDRVQLEDDEAVAAHNLFIRSKQVLTELVLQGRSGRFLRNTWRTYDIRFCTKLNSVRTVPRAIHGKNILVPA